MTQTGKFPASFIEVSFSLQTETESRQQTCCQQPVQDLWGAVSFLGPTHVEKRQFIIYVYLFGILRRDFCCFVFFCVFLSHVKPVCCALVKLVGPANI